MQKSCEIRIKLFNFSSFPPCLSFICSKNYILNDLFELLLIVSCLSQYCKTSSQLCQGQQDGDLHYTVKITEAEEIPPGQ